MMKNKKKGIIIISIITIFAWIGVIFFMSSQSAVSSGSMSRAVTKLVVETGESLGVLEGGTVNSPAMVSKYDNYTRSAAHVALYFLLSLIVLSGFRLWGLYRGKWMLTGFLLCIAVSLLDELNQMRYDGRNDYGLISSAATDLFKDVLGISAALLICLLLGRHRLKYHKN
jgi:VanZ family protein